VRGQMKEFPMFVTEARSHGG